MDEEVDVAKANAQETGEQFTRKGMQHTRSHMYGTIALGGFDCITRSPIVEWRQDYHVDLLLEKIKQSCDGQRIHANGKVLTVILQNTKWQNHRPTLGNGSADLLRQHHFVAQTCPPCMRRMLAQ
jgi:hypothetical protein